MHDFDREPTRRNFLRWVGAGVVGSAGLPLLHGCGDAGAADAIDPTQITMDGHVHVTNRIYWEGIDPWQPNTPGGGWDFARARTGGLNCIIENIGTYACWNYDYTPKQAPPRLMETLWKFAAAHADTMAIALRPADARTIIASGRMAVFIGCESGFDHEGDTLVLEALHRLGLRTVQFATQTGFNAFADSATAPLQGGQAPNNFGGIDDLGRKLVSKMNDLGILIDITHGTAATMAQLVDASRAPVVASHEVIRSVSGTAGITDDLIKAIAAKGGLVGIHGAGISKRYAQWAASNPAIVAAQNAPVGAMLGFQPSFPRLPGDHGEYIARFDAEFQSRWRARPRDVPGWEEKRESGRRLLKLPSPPPTTMHRDACRRGHAEEIASIHRDLRDSSTANASARRRSKAREDDPRQSAALAEISAH